MENDLAVIILAAGKSKRMGDEIKQLVKYKEESFLENTVKKVLTFSNNVYVVLGHEYEKCSDCIKDYDVSIVRNDKYDEGISSSIRAGISNTKKYDRTMVLLCDQPFMPTSHLKNMIDLNIDKIVATASTYKEIIGVPAIFPKRYYNDLLRLRGDSGAKKVIQKNEFKKIYLDKNYLVDIDTKEDKKKYLEIDTFMML